MILTVNFLLAIAALFGSALAKRDKIKLRDVQTLTFVQNEVTNSRRSHPVPQLRCIGGTARYDFSPKSVQCYNRGFDGSDVQWECKTDLKNKYSFGKIFVNCEGYDYPEDEYILVGSCGLEYELDYNSPRYEKKSASYSYNYKHNDKASSIFGIGFIIFAICAIALIYYCLPRTPSNSRPEPSAPPPPGFNPNFFDDRTYGSTNYGYQGDSCSRNQYRQSQPSMTSNLWSGIFGAGLGYMMGRNSNSSYYPHSRERSSFTDYTTSHTAYESDNSENVRTASGFATTKRR
ncbi:store-operated calcium entry-associated regulatory factor-like protein [Leptotrombidium deliense]|uniref:Store-operated calcium entry-associated regulatory factor n=1 Tax=Leptotrombidium deliense TaxID=299467 RepID=A0A443SK69_9ACAR|nr:store-operated calcium entry-associated regulatory factor-like protein [Leptotrombidium deliense]